MTTDAEGREITTNEKTKRKEKKSRRREADMHSNEKNGGIRHKKTTKQHNRQNVQTFCFVFCCVFVLFWFCVCF